MSEIMRFFNNQQSKGIQRTREKQLKKWARENRMSPTTLHKNLDSLWSMGYIIKYPKRVKGRHAVFYELSSLYRDWWITEVRSFEDKARAISTFGEGERVLALKELLSSTATKFLVSIPFFICYVLQNEDRLEDLQESLDKFWTWCLSPYIFATAQACLRDKEIASKFEIMQMINSGYKEYLKSDFYKRLKEGGILP